MSLNITEFLYNVGVTRAPGSQELEGNSLQRRFNFAQAAFSVQSYIGGYGSGLLLSVILILLAYPAILHFDKPARFILSISIFQPCCLASVGFHVVKICAARWNF